jgi:CBS domain-containing protein
MLVSEVMCSKPEYLSPEATLKQAALQMRAHDYGFMPIGENDRLIGAITDRDIAIRAVAEGKDPNKTLLGNVMSKGIHYCLENDDLEDAVHKMQALHVKRLVVLNKDKRMIGIIAFKDIATKCKDADLRDSLADESFYH